MFCGQWCFRLWASSRWQAESRKTPWFSRLRINQRQLWIFNPPLYSHHFRKPTLAQTMRLCHSRTFDENPYPLPVDHNLTKTSTKLNLKSNDFHPPTSI
eukprot:978755-Amphidinium_carterae.1